MADGLTDRQTDTRDPMRVPFYEKKKGYEKFKQILKNFLACLKVI